MRILFCTDTYPPQVNGVSVVTALMARGLRRRGWECAVIAPRYPPSASLFDAASEESCDRTSIPSIPLPGYRDVRVALPARRVVRELIDRFEPDLIHCATEFVIGGLGLSAALATRIPVCTSYHTDFARYAAAYGVPWLRGPVTRWIARFHSRSARIFTPSGSARDALAQLGLSNVEVWGRGVDVALFHPARRSGALRHRLGLEGGFTFLHVGRLAREKEVEVLLAAFSRLERSVPTASVRLVIAGAGPIERVLRRQATHGVQFLGNLDRHRELPALYASADAFVFSSSTETLGLVVLEAMSSGLPVIAAPVGGVSDLLRDGVNGLAFPARDVDACASAMRRISSDAALCGRLAAGARQTAESRTWDDEIARLDASYREVLRRPPAP